MLGQWSPAKPLLMPFLESRVVWAVPSQWPRGMRGFMHFSGPWWQFAGFRGAWVQDGDRGGMWPERHTKVQSQSFGVQTLLKKNAETLTNFKLRNEVPRFAVWKLILEADCWGKRTERGINRKVLWSSDWVRWWLECVCEGNGDKWVGFEIRKGNYLHLWLGFGWDEIEEKKWEEIGNLKLTCESYIAMSWIG